MKKSKNSIVLPLLLFALLPAVSSPLAAQTAAANMVRIQGGTFAMGSPRAVWEEAYRDDLDYFVYDELRHSVTISPFYMGKYEVTQKEWRDIMGYGTSEFSGDDLPVESVSWYEAIEYCNKRSQREGLTPAYTIDKSRKDPNNTAPSTSKWVFENDTIRWMVTWNRKANGYRLPTEAEWEYACRAGTSTPYYTGNTVDGAGWYRVNSGNKTHPIGQKQPNAWGLYDMHGNVYEWCWDWYDEYPRGAQTDPAGAGTGFARVVRGGSWFDGARILRSTGRGGGTSISQRLYLGFRLARSGSGG
jgi:formylglycine-generating enzyme required for sulfatase activity